MNRTATVLLTITAVAGLSIAHRADVLLAAGAAEAQEIGIDERLGGFVPLDLGFLDARGDSVYLRDVVTRPTILTLVYYHCPTICKPLLSGVAEVVGKTDMLVGKDYNLLTISFDPYDNPGTAGRIKTNFTNSLAEKLRGDAWKFLTADSVTIAHLTEAVGFRYKRQKKDFAHGTSLIVLSPDGKIVRYFYGLRFMPSDLKMAVADANKGEPVPSITRILRYCFSYDPKGRRYVINVTRVAGAAILVLALGWVAYISTVGRIRKARSKA